jgi:hypothetical protein
VDGSTSDSSAMTACLSARLMPSPPTAMDHGTCPRCRCLRYPRCHAVAGTTVDECADLAHDDGCPVADSRMLTAHVDTQGLRSVARMAAGDA